MQKTYSKFRSIVLVGFMVACNNGKNSSNAPKRKPSEPDKKPSNGKTCTTTSINEILKDGRTIVSQSKSAENAILLWDVFSQKVKRKIDFAFKYLDISMDGEYMIQKINERRFQILSIVNEKINYNESLSFRRGTKPKLKFSEDGNFVTSVYESAKGKFKVNVFNVHNRDFIYSAFIKNFKSIFVHDFENIIILKSNSSLDNKLSVTSLRTGQKNEFKMYKGEIKSSFITKDLLVVQIDSFLHSISLQHLEYLVSIKVSEIFSVDKESETALVQLKDSNKNVILDLSNGRVIHEIHLDDEDVVLSKCELNSQAESVICKSKREEGQVKVYNFITSKEKNICI